ncbi:hypothetical protein EC988_006674, partial [Linderina pennispora]
ERNGPLPEGILRLSLSDVLAHGLYTMETLVPRIRPNRLRANFPHRMFLRLRKHGLVWR